MLRASTRDLAILALVASFRCHGLLMMENGFPPLHDHVGLGSYQSERNVVLLRRNLDSAIFSPDCWNPMTSSPLGSPPMSMGSEEWMAWTRGTPGTL